MKIAIIGVTGRAGSRIAEEACRRGHSVTGIVRNPQEAPTPEGCVSLAKGDATQPEQLAPLLKGHDVVISAAHFRTLKAAPLLQAVKDAGVPRLIVVGGAASLEVAPGKIVLDDPNFPEAYKVEAVPGKQFLDDLREEKGVLWTFMSPPAEFAPGQRTGKFRVGKDQLMVDANGRSHISMEDYAIALVDELENPQHTQTRFTVGY
ncbi:NAD(P)-dependent oxidoreductase [Silvimonas amylolytica]|uniref:3-beta hydroxysteroid dehydrogenase n=1 Tax=Silvimonas amylolytica TaxID=449663 RepID=A0ABQ2PIE9_9NEIS|nr:NAD(P)-dependent oxidoreductase [Silvimonas amylolytica]GGP24749.1 3-beta hydroxysteroid dehydrogenase [Silvimonas amylolytica]